MVHCAACDVLWSGPAPCWVCGEPGVAVKRPVTPDAAHYDAERATR